MIFRTQVAVLRAIPEQYDYIAEADVTWHDAVSYTFGINAPEVAEATRIAVQAAENAVDREGSFIGGVVIEARSRCIGPEEFDGYGDYLLQSIDALGIFYVSGVTFFAIGRNKTLGAARELESFRERINRFGLPGPSFVHPKPKEKPPQRVRLFCPVCEHWVEVDSGGLLYSFFDGLEHLSDEFREGREAVSVAGPFFQKHLECLMRQESHSALVFIYDSDERYTRLEESKRE
jgi:hypothetical protein